MRFRGVGPALLFAFAEHEVVEQSAIFRMRGPSKSTADEKMTPFDLAAQAGQIRGMVERLREPARSAVISRYGAKHEKIAAYHAMAPYTGVEDEVFARAILALANRSKNLTVGAVAQRLGVTVGSVESARVAAERILIEWTADGESQVAAVLREKGLLDGD